MGVQLQETDYPSKIKIEELCRLFASFYDRPADWNLLLAQLGLDELTTGLDPEVRQNMWMSFESIRKSGVAILMVSHYLDEVEILADKILYLEKGRQQFFGTQNDFRNYAKSRIPESQQKDLWEEECPLEKIYLMIAPKTTGLTMEGIL